MQEGKLKTFVFSDQIYDQNSNKHDDKTAINA